MLTESQVESFQRDGFVNGGACLSGEEVEELRAEMERVIADKDDSDISQPVLLRNLAQVSYEQRWQIVNIWMASPPYRRLVQHPKITEDLAQLTGAKELRVWHDQVQYKPAGVGGVTGWHQDAPLWPVLAPMTEVSAWVALDDVDESNGCMSMVPGSHTWGVQSDFLRQLPRDDFHAMPLTCDGHEVRVVRRPVRKGEVHYHHALTWHGSHANMSQRPRRAIAIHYMQNGTRFVASGDHVMKQFITVNDGESIEGEYFPLCYSAAAV